MDIQFVSDSKAFIDWDKYGTSSLQTLVLEHWMVRGSILIHNFAQISFWHIYRDFNDEVNGLSKKGIGDMDRYLFF